MFPVADEANIDFKQYDGDQENQTKGRLHPLMEEQFRVISLALPADHHDAPKHRGHDSEEGEKDDVGHQGGSRAKKAVETSELLGE